MQKLGEIFLQKAMLNAPDLDIKTFLCYCILNSLMKHYCWKRQLWSSAAVIFGRRAAMEIKMASWWQEEGNK